MKINGLRIAVKNETVIPIIKTGQTIYLIATPVSSYSDFDTVCPMPVAPVGGPPGQERALTDSKEYQNKLREHYVMFNEWLIVSCLKEAALEIEVEIANPNYIDPDKTPNILPIIKERRIKRYPLEWETVDLKNPKTFENWRVELRENNKFTEADLRHIVAGVMECNNLSEELIEAAKQNFLALPLDQEETM